MNNRRAQRFAVSLPIAVLLLNSVGISALPNPVLPPDEQKIVLSLPVVPPGLNRAYCLDVKPSKTVTAVYTYTVNAPELTAREWVVFAPHPPNLPGQTVRSARTSPASTVVRDLSPRQQPLFQARVPADTPALRQRITFQMFIEADLFSRKLVPDGTDAPTQPAVAPLPDSKRMLSLRPTSQFDYSNELVSAWSTRAGVSRRAPNEGEIDFARRVFQAIAKNFQYEYRNGQDHGASHACAVGRSDCGGLCALFVAVLRSQGVPARTLAGRWAKSAKPGEEIGGVVYFQEHVKAEFFAQGVGWVPADLSSAVLHDSSPEKLRFFGNDPGDFLTLHLDTDLTFDTLHFGKKTMTSLQKASYWATGSGDFNGTVVHEDWRVY